MYQFQTFKTYSLHDNFLEQFCLIGRIVVDSNQFLAASQSELTYWRP